MASSVKIFTRTFKLC